MKSTKQKLMYNADYNFALVFEYNPSSLYVCKRLIQVFSNSQNTQTLLTVISPTLDQLKPFEDFLAFVQKSDYEENLYVNGQLIQIICSFLLFFISYLCFANFLRACFDVDPT